MQINEIERSALAGQVALIAGGTGNVGRVLVRSMLERGATVVVPSRSRGKLEQLQAYVARDGERLRVVEGDIGDERAGPDLVARVISDIGPIDAAVATLGRFVPAHTVLGASRAELQEVVDGYLLAHFAAARVLIPALEPGGGSYTFINGPLAFQPMYPGTGLVSIVTAAQAMLARVVMQEAQASAVRVNEVVLYTPFGWGEDGPQQGAVTQDDVGRYVALLSSPRASAVRGRTIALDSLDRFGELELSV
jgi:NAD(P)-dependent dehydrogenase (short-subunit alcohol dehydrogenase family)